jgi:hypothetical protein
LANPPRFETHSVNVTNFREVKGLSLGTPLAWGGFGEGLRSCVNAQDIQRLLHSVPVFRTLTQL